jgi:hypothetical protein
LPEPDDPDDPDDPESSRPEPDPLELPELSSRSSDSSSAPSVVVTTTSPSSRSTALFGADVVGEGAVAGIVLAGAGAVVEGIVVEGIVVEGTVVEGTVATLVVAGSWAGTGFCQTDAGLVGPMLGKRLSLIAFATPTTPSVANRAIVAPAITPRQPDVHLGREGTPARSSSTLDVESTGTSSTPSVSWPCCSQSLLTGPVSQTRPSSTSDNGRSTPA